MIKVKKITNNAAFTANEMRAVVNRLQELRLGICDSGEFLDENTRLRLHNNHVKCILRKDLGFDNAKLNAILLKVRRILLEFIENNPDKTIEYRGVGYLNELQ
jgi:hypothetical protein